MEDLTIKVRDIFVFEQSGVADNGRIVGEFRGSKPSDEFMQRLRLSGAPVPQQLFDQVLPIL
jgi:pilus assembly protein CpaF